MNIKRKLKKAVLIAAMAGAMIAGTPHPSFSELSNKDRIRVTELERTDREKYNFIVEQSKKLESLFKTVEDNLRKLGELEKRKTKSVSDSYRAFISLSEDLRILDDSVYFSIRQLRNKTGLELKSSEGELEELYEDVFDLMIDYGEFCYQTWKKNGLSANERTMAHKLIDLLEKYKERGNAKELAKSLKALLAKKVGERFP